ncbi:MAG: Coenzyme F420 hydrogenase/dehydrogenase, beta subunit C-terminal domain [Promethearchaeota archaeon]
MDNIVANNIEIEKKQLEKMSTRMTFGTLKKKVIDPGLCIECGKCVALCDVIDWNSDRHVPVLVGRCIACGLCYHQCPQSPGSPIGDFSRALVTRSSIDGVRGQDGGTVTSLVVALLEKGAIQAAVLTKQDPEKPWYPKPFIATTRQDVLSASGTIYSHSPVVPVLLDAINKGYKKVAVVSTACKIQAIRDLESDVDGLLRNIDGLSILKIGLFCSESFIPERLLSFIDMKVDSAKVKKIKISNGMLWVHTDDGKESFGLTSYAGELHGCTKKSCLNCNDFSAQDADISVGNIGSDSKHNTVLVRSGFGADMLDIAIRGGYLESRDARKGELKPLVDIAWEKKNRGVIRRDVVAKPGMFKHHDPASWNVDDYNYTPSVRTDLYKRVPHEISTIHAGNPGGPDVLVAKVPDASKDEITTYNYSTAYDLTWNLLKNYEKIKGGKVFIKPNNTGFVGIFKKNPRLAYILEKNGITDDADHQPLATHPSTIQGIVDAMLDLGAKTIHVGENMLWDGGTPRAFYETGYCHVFSQEKYRGKVQFVDFYEDDPPPPELKKLKVKKGKYDISSYYTHLYPPKPLFDEKYDLVYIASIAKVHNCSYYSLTTKNFSVSMNPRKKAGKIEPRWHIHGVPIEVFRKEYLKKLFGDDFKRKYQYLVRETYPHKWGANLKERTVKPKKSKVILSGRLTTKLAKSLPATLHSSGLMAWFKSFGQWVLNVDPHHWAGVSQLAMNLGMGFLTTRFTGMYAAMVEALKENGTDVAGLVTGVVAQEGDGPLIYGNVKHGGFAVAGFDACAVEKITLDIMFGDGGDFQKAIVQYQRKLMEKFGVKNELLLDEARRMWTLELLSDLTGGTIDNTKMNITLLNYAGDVSLGNISPGELYKIRNGPPFTFSEAFYCSPDTWLKLIHTDEDMFRIAFTFTTKSIDIPLIPDVVG